MICIPREDQIIRAFEEILQETVPQYADLHHIAISEFLEKNYVCITFEPATPMIRFFFPNIQKVEWWNLNRKMNLSILNSIIQALARKTFSIPYDPTEKPKQQENRFVSYNTYERRTPNEIDDLASVSEESRRQAVNNLAQIKTALDQTRNALQQNLSKYNQLYSSLRDACNGPGFRKLAQLHQRMCTVSDVEIQAFAEELECAMISLGMVPFKPAIGELYDSSCHERRSGYYPGNRITAVHSSGWTLDKEVLLRAIVDTGHNLYNTNESKEI